MRIVLIVYAVINTTISKVKLKIILTQHFEN